MKKTYKDWSSLQSVAQRTPCSARDDALVIRVQVATLLPSVRADARVHADPCASENSDISRLEEAGDAVDSNGGRDGGFLGRSPEDGVRDGRNRDTHVIQPPALAALLPRTRPSAPPRLLPDLDHDEQATTCCALYAWISTLWACLVTISQQSRCACLICQLRSRGEREAASCLCRTWPPEACPAFR